ncbi:MAG TPA: Asp-tRNA(Asn)/Glu-tRNA(Gln) amidotransferase subunit GatC [Candidatus Dormibacteraeota bacterium]|nr:Asp-tRNA(Asn)/Glu-tRNA(Gln) amidotransferase subunit GatC [Candidatus Dormibacteraeota bacterium]
MSKITPEEVQRVAALAQIGLKDEEIEPLSRELGKIVGFVEQLQKADTKGVPPTNQVTGLTDVWREDVVKQSPKREDMLANAPQQEKGYFKVKRVLE